MGQSESSEGVELPLPWGDTQWNLQDEERRAIFKYWEERTKVNGSISSDTAPTRKERLFLRHFSGSGDGKVTAKDLLSGVQSVVAPFSQKELLDVCFHMGPRNFVASLHEEDSVDTEKGKAGPGPPSVPKDAFMRWVRAKAPRLAPLIQETCREVFLGGPEVAPLFVTAASSTSPPPSSALGTAAAATTTKGAQQEGTIFSTSELRALALCILPEPPSPHWPVIYDSTKQGLGIAQLTSTLSKYDGPALIELSDTKGNRFGAYVSTHLCECHDGNFCEPSGLAQSFLFCGRVGESDGNEGGKAPAYRNPLASVCVLQPRTGFCDNHFVYFKSRDGRFSPTGLGWGGSDCRNFRLFVSGASLDKCFASAQGLTYEVSESGFRSSCYSEYSAVPFRSIAARCRRFTNCH